jgi:protein-S-isoprenylcysteine O-methyltransferase Ste14
MRHPGYAGWLLWAVATQLLLGNPVCAVVFAVVVSQQHVHVCVRVYVCM